MSWNLMPLCLNKTSSTSHPHMLLGCGGPETSSPLKQLSWKLLLCRIQSWFFKMALEGSLRTQNVLEGKVQNWCQRATGECVHMASVLKSWHWIVLGEGVGRAVLLSQQQEPNCLLLCCSVTQHRVGPLHLPQKDEKSSSDHFCSSSTKFITQHKEDKI